MVGTQGVSQEDQSLRKGDENCETVGEREVGRALSIIVPCDYRGSGGGGGGLKGDGS
jgi:hypothetical protein